MAVFSLTTTTRTFSAIPVFVLLLVLSEGKRFEVFDVMAEPQSVCGIVDADFKITLTVLKVDTALKSISMSSDSIPAQHFGVCEKFMSLRWAKSNSFDITQSIHNIEFSFSFDPYEVFGDLAPSKSRVTFFNPVKAVLEREDSSYKCSKENAQLYTNVNKPEGTARYQVLVDMNDVQIQLKHVINNTFSRPGPECLVTPVAPPTQPSFWDLHWRVIAITVSVMVCVSVAFLVGFHHYQIWRAGKVRRIQSIIDH